MCIDVKRDRGEKCDEKRLVYSGAVFFLSFLCSYCFVMFILNVIAIRHTMSIPSRVRSVRRTYPRQILHIVSANGSR